MFRHVEQSKGETTMSKENTTNNIATTVINGLKANFQLASGVVEETEFTLPYQFTSDCDDRLANRAATLAYDLHIQYGKVVSGYFSALPVIAKIISDEPWKALKGCKGVNAFVESITGASKSTVSEMIKVAKCFYTSNGAVIEGWDLLTYSEMIAFSKYDEDIRTSARDKIMELGERRSRKAVKELLENERLALLEEKNKEEYEEQSRQIEESKNAETETREYSNPEEELKAENKELSSAVENGEFENVVEVVELLNTTQTVISDALLHISLDNKASKTILLGQVNELSKMLANISSYKSLLEYITAGTDYQKSVAKQISDKLGVNYNNEYVQEYVDTDSVQE